MRIVTNFERFEPVWTSRGETGEAVTARTFSDFLRELPACDLLLINCDIALTLRLSAYFVMFPWKRKPIVAVDLVLRRPKTFQARMAALVKRALLARVDHFINYFRDLDGYSSWYGITPERSSFVPFKPNLRYRYEPRLDLPEGDYVLCFGRSLRDYDTFFDAMEGLPFHGAIPTPDFPSLRVHDSRFTRPLDRLPANVRILDDDGSQQTMIRAIEGAKVVAVPVLRSTFAASGISVYLNAMLLGRSVVISNGPGVSDVLTDQAIMVPPEDPTALREAIARVWEDDALRTRLVESGRKYALSLGGEPELRARVLESALAWLRGGLSMR
jgi:glycosyltransferase involved in cell wall biosynthesis